MMIYSYIIYNNCNDYKWLLLYWLITQKHEKNIHNILYTKDRVGLQNMNRRKEKKLIRRRFNGKCICQRIINEHVSHQLLPQIKYYINIKYCMEIPNLLYNYKHWHTTIYPVISGMHFFDMMLNSVTLEVPSSFPAHFEKSISVMRIFVLQRHSWAN